MVEQQPVKLKNTEISSWTVTKDSNLIGCYSTLTGWRSFFFFWSSLEHGLSTSWGQEGIHTTVPETAKIKSSDLLYWVLKSRRSNHNISVTTIQLFFLTVATTKRWGFGFGFGFRSLQNNPKPDRRRVSPHYFRFGHSKCKTLGSEAVVSNAAP